MQVRDVHDAFNVDVVVIGLYHHFLCGIDFTYRGTGRMVAPEENFEWHIVASALVHHLNRPVEHQQFLLGTRHLANARPEMWILGHGGFHVAAISKHLRVTRDFTVS